MQRRAGLEPRTLSKITSFRARGDILDETKQDKILICSTGPTDMFQLIIRKLPWTCFESRVKMGLICFPGLMVRASARGCGRTRSAKRLLNRNKAAFGGACFTH